MPQPPEITLETTVEELVLRYPETVAVFFKHGIPAISCGTPIWGTIGENAKKYGVKDPEKLLADLRAKVQQAQPLTLKIQPTKPEE